MALARSARLEPESGFLAWWLGELRAVLPRRWREAGPRRQPLVLQLERPFVRVLERRGRRLESVGSLLLPEAGAGAASTAVEPRLRRSLGRHNDAAVLVLGEDDALTCTDVLPAAAEADVARIMGHKLDLLTPWSAEQGYAAQKVLGRRRDGTLEVLLAAASRPRLDELLGQLEALGVKPAAVDVILPGGDGRRTAGVDLLRGGGGPERRGPGLLRMLILLLALALMVGAGLVGWQIYQRQRMLSEQARLAAGLDQRLADLPELRARIEAMRAQARFLADDRSSRPSPLLVLEALSRLLPDTVWLTEATLDGNEVAVSGMAEDASALIPLVEAAPEFEQVRFQAPSTRVTVRGVDGAERQVERFALRAVVDPAAEPAW
jgi:general secretion pathway protein L